MVIGQLVKDEIPVRRQGIKAGLGVNDGPERAGDVLGEKITDPLKCCLIRLEGSGLGSYLYSAGILPRLGSIFSEYRKAIKAGIVHPDPDGKATGVELSRTRTGKVRHLFLSDR